MRLLNWKELQILSKDKSYDVVEEGYVYYRKVNSNEKLTKLFFMLKANLLFVFSKHTDKHPFDVILLEAFQIDICENMCNRMIRLIPKENSSNLGKLELVFLSNVECARWINALTMSSCTELLSTLRMLEAELVNIPCLSESSITGTSSKRCEKRVTAVGFEPTPVYTDQNTQPAIAGSSRLSLAPWTARPRCLHSDFPGWVRYNNYCYRFVYEPKKYENAKLICASYNSMLFIPQTDKDWSSVTTDLPPGTSFWIGLQFQNGKLKWQNESSFDVEKLPFLVKLKKSQRIKVQRQECLCMFARNGKPKVIWIPCIIPRAYICQKDAEESNEFQP
ncbi:Snaclec alboaggregin-A subunit alpha' [Trichinella pseudospiralis]|uniref:Snaclec alboaggregin-A subunit alpha n=1 Tax=Trichinella pseudospiralis TaxID=6337 RepID=A0A0V0YPA1_TRIPS|nr:Snaclec alboaggregin-A subunit alpha' [Trichinella pseudospiralis]